jgi:hypothetical protein
MDDVWNNYPPELLAQAHANEVLAEQQLLAVVPCDPDPYNVTLVTLILRWWTRKAR